MFGEFNACGMFVLLPIVENLESSEMFGEAAKSSPPRVQIFHQTYLSLCLSFLLQKHPMNSPFTEFLFLGLGLYQVQRVQPLPLGSAQPGGVGTGPEVERPPRMSSYLSLSIVPRGQLKRTSFYKEFGTINWNDHTQGDCGNEKVGNEDVKHRAMETGLLAVPTQAPLM